MNEFENDSTEIAETNGSSAQIGLALLSAAFCIFLFSQISNLGQNASSMKWQGENLNRQIQSLTGAEKNAQELIKQREATVQQTQQVQERYTSLLTDIKGDDAPAYRWLLTSEGPPLIPDEVRFFNPPPASRASMKENVRRRLENSLLSWRGSGFGGDFFALLPPRDPAVRGDEKKGRGGKDSAPRRLARG